MGEDTVLLLGAGRMGGALVRGWRAAGAPMLEGLIVRDPAAVAADFPEARLNPPDADLAQARRVVLAVKPQIWRAVAEAAAPRLAKDAVIVSVAAGVRLADLSAAFGGRSAARVMPTTAVAVRRGAASIAASDARARAAARALFEPVATCVDIADEALMDVTVAVSGSAPAYLYAFIEALEAAGAAEGLPEADARRLVRATLVGAAALLDATGADPGDLRREVTSPGGTTEAALEVLMGPSGLFPLARAAVAAAAARSRALGG